MGGADGSFRTTRWTRIEAAQTADSTRRREAVKDIVDQYWKPVYVYLRRKGRTDADAKDLAQGFFLEIVLGGPLLQKADRARGMFRKLLQAALRNYVTSLHRAEKAQKRSPPGGLVSLNSFEPPEIPVPDGGAGPEEAFTYAWASQLLDGALAATEEACRAAGQGKHWEVFRLTELEPKLRGAAAPTLKEVCRRLGIAGAVRASNMKITAKRRFRTILRATVRQFVVSDEEVEEEIRDLIQILSRRPAGP